MSFSSEDWEHQFSDRRRNRYFFFNPLNDLGDLQKEKKKSDRALQNSISEHQCEWMPMLWIEWILTALLIDPLMLQNTALQTAKS